MNYSFTISKKLFLIFIINLFIILTILVIVSFLFSDLSDHSKQNSKLLNYKINLDAIRVEQAKLKGMTQSFYLNVNQDSVNKGIFTISNSFDMIIKYINELKSDQNKIINNLILESKFRDLWIKNIAIEIEASAILNTGSKNTKSSPPTKGSQLGHVQLNIGN